MKIFVVSGLALSLFLTSPSWAETDLAKCEVREVIRGSSYAVASLAFDLEKAREKALVNGGFSEGQSRDGMKYVVEAPNAYHWDTVHLNALIEYEGQIGWVAVRSVSISSIPSTIDDPFDSARSAAYKIAADAHPVHLECYRVSETTLLLDAANQTENELIKRTVEDFNAEE